MKKSNSTIAKATYFLQALQAVYSISLYILKSNLKMKIPARTFN